MIDPPLRLLFLLPFPPSHHGLHGGARVTAALIDALADRHAIAVLYLRHDGDDPVDPALAARCAVIEEVSVRAMSRLPLHLIRQWRRWRGVPDWLVYTWLPAMAARARALVRTWRPHIVHLEYHVMGQYAAAVRGVPLVLTEYEPACSAMHSEVPLSTARRRRHASAWSRFERRLLDEVDAVVAFTDRDVTALRDYGSATPLVCIPFRLPGARLPSHPGGAGESEKGSGLLFVGNFMHPPNIDAARRLIDTIYPIVRAAHPHASLAVVGANPPRWLREAAGDGITVTGRVDDTAPFLSRAAVVVVPMYVGGGMRVKVLEACAAGKATVATPLAVEGLPLVSGEHVLVADNDRGLADATIRLLRDPARRRMLGDAARAWAQTSQDREAWVAQYDALYDRLLRGARNATHA